MDSRPQGLLAAGEARRGPPCTGRAGGGHWERRAPQGASSGCTHALSHGGQAENASLLHGAFPQQAHSPPQTIQKAGPAWVRNGCTWRQSGGGWQEGRGGAGVWETKPPSAPRCWSRPGTCCPRGHPEPLPPVAQVGALSDSAGLTPPQAPLLWTPG